MMDDQPLPKRWANLTQALKHDEWVLTRISGSHHIFTKPGRRCIPVAFHGGTVSPKYASLVLRQAGLVGSITKQRSTEVQDIADTTELEDNNDESKEECRRKSVRMEKPIRKADKDDTQRRQAQTTLLQKEFQRLHIEKDQNSRMEAQERSDLLDYVQGLIADGEYKDAIECMSSIDVGDFGSSSDVYHFNCDVLFYRVVAISEYALNMLLFNSKAQHDMIHQGLASVVSFMERSPERREDGRKLAKVLQERVVAKYLDGLSEVFQKYGSLENTKALFDLNKREEDPEFPSGPFGLMLAKKIISEKKLDERFASGNYPTKDEIYDLMDQIVVGFQFVVSVTDGNKIPFMAALSHSSFSKIQLVSLVNVCIRKMFIAFDAGEYQRAGHLSDSIFCFATKHKDVLDVFNAIQVGIFPQCTWITSKLLCGIATHVKGMIPIFKFAQTKLHWNRFAGVIAEIVPCTSFQGEIEDLLNFFEKVINEFSRINNFLTDLVVSNNTRTFVIDTLSDLVQLAHIALQRKLFEENGDISKYAMKALTQYIKDLRQNDNNGFDAYSLEMSPRFRKSKYDKLRVNSVRLLLSLLSVACIYEDLMAIDSFSRKKMFENDMFLLSYVKTLPQTLTELNMLMNLLFGPKNISVGLLRQAVVLRNDFEIAANYYVKIGSEGKILGQDPLAGGLESPEAVIACGIWSFTLVFNIFGRSFLKRFVFGEEQRKLMIIDTLAEQSVLVLDNNLPIEALLFDTLSKLVSLDESNSLVSEVETALFTILSDPVNQEWCYKSDSDGQKKRWVKDKARKFTKLITRFRHSVEGTDVRNSLSQRKKSVDYLLQKLQESILAYRKLPSVIQHEIEQTGSHEKTLGTVEYLKQWTCKEVYEVVNNLFYLESVAESVSTFFYRSSGGALPEIKSVTNPSWNMRDWIALQNANLTVESLNAICDVRYVSAILHKIGR